MGLKIANSDSLIYVTQKSGEIYENMIAIFLFSMLGGNKKKIEKCTNIHQWIEEDTIQQVCEYV